MVGALVWSSAGAGAQSPATTTEAWRSSWSAFVQAVEQWRAAGNTVPTASFESLIKGDPMPPDLPAMKKFGGAVTFEGTFKAVGTYAMMSGMTAKIQLDLPASKGKAADHAFEGMAHIYPATDAIGVWKAIPAGSVVKFRAVVKGVAAMEPSPGRLAYIVLLQDARPLTTSISTRGLSGPD
jgi:hypothetical protein